MSAQTITTEEMLESLTGYEEIAIAKAFGAEVLDLAQHRQTTFMRALVFVHLRREGAKDAEAKDKALSMTLRDAQGMFADDADMAVQIESGEGVTPSE